MKPTAANRSLSATAQRAGGTAVHSEGMVWFARLGLVARGVVYGIIGVLAIEVATGTGGETTNQQGALQAVAGQSFGGMLLAILALGLAAYAAWRLTRAIVGHGTRERDSGFDRVAAAGSGLVYLGLAVVALKILVGGGGGSSGSPKRTTAGVLGWSGGTEIVAIAGAVLIGIGLYQGYKGLTRKFLEEADTSRMSEGVERAYVAVGVFGHLARMVVFGLTGYGLLSAAIDYEPRKAIGLDGALRDLANSSDGGLLLGLVAAGLLGFALYSMLDAPYRNV